MGLHIKEGQEMRRWKPIFSDLDQDLDQPRQPGEYPPWFKHYKEAAEETRHGLLILQLTDSYLKLLSSVGQMFLFLSSFRCMWVLSCFVWVLSILAITGVLLRKGSKKNLRLQGYNVRIALKY